MTLFLLKLLLKARLRVLHRLYKKAGYRDDVREYVLENLLNINEILDEVEKSLKNYN